MGSAASAFGLFDIGIAFKVDAKVSFNVVYYGRCFGKQAQLLHVVFCQPDTTGQNRNHSLVIRRHLLPLTFCRHHATTCDIVHVSPLVVD